MARFYFTFGMGWSLRDSYVAVEADSWEAARWAFVVARLARFGTLEGWAFQYPEEEFAMAIGRYDMTEVPIDTPNIYRS